MKSIGRLFLTIFKKILFLIGLVILPIMSWAIMGSIQSLIFVPDDFIMWTVGDSVPVIGLFLFSVFVFYLVIFKKAIKENDEFVEITAFVKRHKKNSIAVFLGILVLIGYYMITNLNVISSDKIVTHSFFHPQGREYSYSDISAIHTGAFNRTIPFIRSKGEFYYIVELDNGKKINLATVGGIKDNEDSWLTIMELDQVFVELDVTKNIDAKDVDFHLNSLDPLYRNRIKNIFSNVK